ncbi:F1 complex, gamma subunit of ATPase [Imleria badia]|nr:F1 complex, gamma subunit of ATPase [Imleria badia]
MSANADSILRNYAADYYRDTAQNPPPPTHLPARKVVKYTEKITKMIASAKLAKAQRAMNAGKEYGIANSEIFDHTPSETPAKRKLFIVVSSDKGLCGGIHSYVSKATRRAIADTENPVDADSPVMIIGDKSKAQLSGVEYDSIALVYNRFISAISYEASIVEVPNENTFKKPPGFRTYEMGDGVTKDLAEFSLANTIYAGLVEAHACEQSARRNAMDNASKYAKDMIGALTMRYNRGRQAAIMNELVNIITGALQHSVFLWWWTNMAYREMEEVDEAGVTE